jgi:hypothetical protein
LKTGVLVFLELLCQKSRRFLGIVIAMYNRDHAAPHFHAIYCEQEITVEIVTGGVNGSFTGRALAHVQE